MKQASTKEMLYKQYVCPHIDYCKNVTRKYLGIGLELDDTFSMVLTHLYDNIIYYKSNKPLQTFLHVCIKRYVYGLNKTRYNELVTMVSIDNNKENKHFAEIPSNNYFQTGDFDKLGTLYFSDPIYCSLKNLKPLDRELVLLHYIDGYDCSEIAKAKGLNCNSVKTRLFISRAIMKYNITGIKPSNISLFSYLEKSAILNAAI